MTYKHTHKYTYIHPFDLVSLTPLKEDTLTAIEAMRKNVELLENL